VRHEIAVQLLRETDMPVQQIADFLRFSSAANFATAFRKWSRQSPSDFRNERG
jgi:AraC-like DNA-binding protein